ncbi:hypothetical protein PsorP6_017513 [Peronosclerospora sorghi]|uniref:Uncharacterized protein n=1 Tax=Peronosclerospora sorghi TaxID=230839 RepID=A0ACC0WNT3_9STRA|nr:hypothetical protein PsorP6_017513 [Peronosclerospora sorghi]
MLGGACVAYATAARLAVVRFVGSMSASADVLALATDELDLSSSSEGSSVTVKWRGKPIFIKHRTSKEIEISNQVDVSNLRDPETNAARVQKPEWLVVLGICTHLGCVPTSDAGDYGGWICPCHGSHYDLFGKARRPKTSRSLRTSLLGRASYFWDESKCTTCNSPRCDWTSSYEKANTNENVVARGREKDMNI